MSKDADDSVFVATQAAELPPGSVGTFIVFEYGRTAEDGEVRVSTGVWTSPEVTNAPIEQQITLTERALNALSVKLDALKGEQARQAGEAH